MGKLDGVDVREIALGMEEFPSKGAIARRLGVNVGTVSSWVEEEKLEEIQLEWVKKAKMELIWRAISKGQINNKDCSEKVKEKIKERVREGVREIVLGMEEFPSYKAIARRLGVDAWTVSSWVEEEKLEEIQLEWVEKANMELIWRAISGREIQKPYPNVEKRIRGRVREGVREIALGMEEFPSYKAIARRLGVNVRTVSSWVEEEKLEEIQIEWVKNANEELLEKERRNILRIVASKKDPGKLGEIAALYFRVMKKLETGSSSLDQQVIQHLPLDHRSRSEEVSKLVEERLIQLWAFRIGFGLVKAGIIKEGDVISTLLHPLYRERLREITGKDIEHVMFHELLERPEIYAGKNVFLIGVVNWLNEKKVGEMMLRLRNAGISQLTFTYPNDVMLVENYEELLQKVGFSVISISGFELVPPEGTEEKIREKLKTMCYFLTLKPEGKGEEAVLELFIRNNNKGSGEKTANFRGATYPEGALKASRASVYEITDLMKVELTPVDKKEIDKDETGMLVCFYLNGRYEGGLIYINNTKYVEIEGEEGFKEKLINGLREEREKYREIVRELKKRGWNGESIRPWGSGQKQNYKNLLKQK